MCNYKSSQHEFQHSNKTKVIKNSFS